MAHPLLASSWKRAALMLAPLLPGLVLAGCGGQPGAVAPDRESTSLEAQPTPSAAVATGSANISVQANTWPVVNNTSATPDYLSKGAQTLLHVVAADADGDSLSFAWTSSCPGVFTNPQSATPGFTLDSGAALTACTMSVTVSDGRGGGSAGAVTLAVGQTTAVVAPTISTSLQSDEYVGVNSPVVMTVDANDLQGRALTFSWSADAGSLAAPVSTAGSSQVVWTSPATTAVGWHVTVVVSNGSVSTSKTFIVQPLVP